MIVDTSALLAILRQERDANTYATVIDEAEDLKISAGTLLEAGIVIDALKDPVISRRLDELVVRAEIAIRPVTAEHVQIGRAAYRDFGKGSGHPAQLNFGDCFAYALAKTTGESLLFKGNDFIHTDLRSGTA